MRAVLALTYTVKHFVFEAGEVQFEKSVFVPGICLHSQLLQGLLQIALQKQCITMISVRVNGVRYWLFPNTCVVDASLRDRGVPQLVILIKKTLPGLTCLSLLPKERRKEEGIGGMSIKADADGNGNDVHQKDML